MKPPEKRSPDDTSAFVQDRALQDLAEAARSVEEARAQERQTLARELHDRVVQPMVALVSAMDALPQQALIADLLADWMLASKNLAREALTALRDVVAGLHTHPYEMQALPSALLKYLAPPFQSRGVRVTVDSHDWPDYLPPEWAFHLYLTVREAVVNAEKHGRASEINVLLRGEAERLDLVISDNGVGFQRSRPRQKKADTALSGNGLGIANMVDRTRLLGGSLTLDSSPGKGARVNITIPRPSFADAPSLSTTPSN